MKKLLRFSFIIIFLLACMFPLNIFAKEPEPEPDPDPVDTPITLPATFVVDNFQFTIEGFALEYYDISAAKIAELEMYASSLHNSHPEANTLIEIIKLLPEERQNEFFEIIRPIIENKPSRRENIAADDILVYEGGGSSSSKILLLGIDMEMSEKLRTRLESLSENMLNAETGVASIPRIVAKIKFNSIPNEYKYAYYKDYRQIFFNNSLGKTATVNGIDLSQSNYFSLGGVDGDDTPIEQFNMGYLQTLIELSKERLSGPTDYVDKRIFIYPYSMSDIPSENIDEELNAPLDNIMLSDFGEDFGVTELKYQYRDIEPSQPKDLEVAVENTAATYPLYIYILSAIGILVGVLVIVSTRLQSKQKQAQQQ